METNIFLLASKMLKTASDTFANRVCNDLDAETCNLITDEIRDDIRKWNSPDDDWPEDASFIPDWVLMRYLSHKLKEDTA